jgi:hypothetical protein
MMAYANARTVLENRVNGLAAALVSRDGRVDVCGWSGRRWPEGQE